MKNILFFLKCSIIYIYYFRKMSNKVDFCYSFFHQVYNMSYLKWSLEKIRTFTDRAKIYRATITQQGK